MRQAPLRLINDLDDGVYVHIDDIAAWLLDCAQGQGPDDHGRAASSALRAASERLIECIPAVDQLRPE